MSVRAIAWTLLLAGWVGLGSFATVLAPSPFSAIALVALWLFALGAAAMVATRDTLSAGVRAVALALCAALTAAALTWSTRGGGLFALLLALCTWAGLTALASGAVRSVRLAQAARPAPPVGAANLGALCAGLALGDPGDLPALALRLGALILCGAAILIVLQRGYRQASPASRCRPGLFDCSLPAWPSGSWRNPQQWPTLLAGLAMLPMMAGLPLMVAWCRAEAVPPQAMILLHFAAMFVPALLLRTSLAKWSSGQLSAVCTACLAAGAVFALWAPAPWNLLGLAVAHGASWSLAWAGQLWAPERRSRQGDSPLRAAIGYAALTLAFGMVVDQFGPAGVAATHAALGGAALLAWVLRATVHAATAESSGRETDQRDGAPRSSRGGPVAGNDRSPPHTTRSA
jgi:hypothetical protein